MKFERRIVGSVLGNVKDVAKGSYCVDMLSSASDIALSLQIVTANGVVEYYGGKIYTEQYIQRYGGLEAYKLLMDSE